MMVVSRPASWVVCLTLLNVALAMEHGLLTSSPQSCQSEFGSILQDPVYTQPLLEGQRNCSQTIRDSFTIQDGTGCPPYDILITCFQLAPSGWTSFVRRCAADIFSAPSNCIGQGVSWADCSRPDEPTETYVVGMQEAGAVNTLNKYQFDSGYVDNAGEGWQSRVYVGGDADKRRRLQQVSDNEGGGGGSGLDAGCFPDFYDISDWQAWLDGTYQEPKYGGNQINPIGVIFWLLQGLGILSMAFI